MFLKTDAFQANSCALKLGINFQKHLFPSSY